MLSRYACCPRCLADIPQPQGSVLPIVVCPHCGHSLRVAPADEYIAAKLALASRRKALPRSPLTAA